MTSFKDTSNWTRIGKTTLVYSYAEKGQKQNGSAEMEPKVLHLLLERMSFHEQAAWALADKTASGNQPGYVKSEFISALGRLDGSVLHAITLDRAANLSCTRVFVSIFAVDEAKLAETSVADIWSAVERSAKPAEGWLKDEIGSIRYRGHGEYEDEPHFSASLFLSRGRFDDLVAAIKANTVRTVQLEILADVYGIAHESIMADLHTPYNYAILCEIEGKNTDSSSEAAAGETKARLEAVRLEWSPVLATQTARRRDEALTSQQGSTDTESNLRNLKASQAVENPSRPGSDKRNVIDLLYLAAFLAAGSVAIWLVFNWLRG